MFDGFFFSVPLCGMVGFWEGKKKLLLRSGESEMSDDDCEVGMMGIS